MSTFEEQERKQGCPKQMQAPKGIKIVFLRKGTNFNDLFLKLFLLFYLLIHGEMG